MKRYLHNSLKKSLLTLTVMVLFIGVSWGQLLQWNTFGNLGTETTEPSVFNDPNISATNLTQGTITAAGNANRFGGSGWFNTGNTPAGNTLAEAIAGNDYIQFIVTPNAGCNFTPTSFDFSWQSSATGPKTVTLRSSADSYVANLGTATVTAVITSYSLTISGLTSITTATTFRLYGYGATATGGTGGFDVGSNVVNVQLNGTTSSVSPTLSASPSSLSGLSYFVGLGPSAVQSFVLTGTNLNGTDVTLTTSTNYEISTSNSPFTATSPITLTSYNGAATTIYVRLKAGLALGTYNSENVVIAGGGATSINETNNGSVINTSTPCGTETFTNSNATGSYTNNSFTGDNGVIWSYIQSRDENGDANGSGIVGKALMLRRSSDGSKVTSSTVTSGIGDFTVKLYKGFTGAGNRQVELYVNGILKGTSTAFDDYSPHTFTVTGINVLGNVIIEIRNKTANQVIVDDISWTCYYSSVPTLTVIPTTLSSLNYVFGTGPSASQSYTLSGSNLTGFPSNITVTGSTNYEVSLDNSTFSGSVNVPYTTATLNVTTIYVRLKVGLSMGSYNGETISNAGGGATTQNVTCNGTVNGLGTSFQRGDFALLSVCSNTSCIGDSAGDDQISFMIFKDINPGDAFIITDNGYERLIAGKWGNSEGTYQLTRTISTISAGTVITIRLHNNSPYFVGSYPDNNWSMTNIGWAGTQCVLNSGGDQIYFMQGGTWNKGTKTGAAFNHDATYTPGVVLYAFNTNTSWTSFGSSTQQSGLLLGMECFYMMPGVATDFAEYTGLVTAATKRDWLNRLNTITNWTSRVDCATYFANNVHYGQTYTINAGGYSDGVWTGEKNIDWFDCGNWQNLDVPSLTTNVSIPNAGVTNEPTIGAPPTTPVLYTSAECNNLTIESSRTLTINNANSILDIYGNITNSGAVSHTNGLVRIYGANTSLTSTPLITFYNLQINKTLGTNIFTLNNNIAVSNSLTLTNGIVSTGANKLSITNSTTANLIHSTGSASFINGYLERSIATNLSTYEFPIGDGTATTNYKIMDFVNNNVAGTTSLLGSVNSISEVGNNIDSRIVATQSGSTLNNIFQAAEWNLIPNIAVSSGNYGVRLYVANTGISLADDNTFCPLKRIDASTDYADWASFETLPTTIPVASAAGRIYNGGNGYAQRLGYTSFSKFAIARTPNFPLPVELVNFNGNYQNKGINLKWQTASETNNNYFEILKSKDLNYFEKLGTVVGAGNTNNISSYEYFDNNPFNGNNYYKLKQVDFDGQSSESNIIVVQVKNNSNIIIFYNNNHLFVTTNNTETINYVEIFDVTGNIAYSSNNNFENNNIQINIENIAKGIYFAKVLSNNQVEVRKFIVK